MLLICFVKCIIFKNFHILKFPMCNSLCFIPRFPRVLPSASLDLPFQFRRSFSRIDSHGGTVLILTLLLKNRKLFLCANPIESFFTQSKNYDCVLRFYSSFGYHWKHITHKLDTPIQTIQDSGCQSGQTSNAIFSVSPLLIFLIQKQLESIFLYLSNHPNFIMILLILLRWGQTEHWLFRQILLFTLTSS